MLDEAEYASDTDESDEDYMPDADGANVGSENESDGEPETALDDADGDDIKTNRSRKRSATATTAAHSKRSRAADTATTATTITKSATEKDELVDDDDEANEEALWAKFLGNSKTANTTQSKSSQPSKPAISTTSSSSSNGSATVKQLKDKDDTAKPPTEKKMTVTEIFEFAGEKVEVQKEIKVTEENPSPSNASATKPAAKSTSGVTLPSFNRRSGGGLSSVLGQIGKKNKLSVLEKTALDWTGFKRNEGIDEELQTHNKGRDGYLERQDFLQRTDLRQFEIEKSMRQASRRK